MKHLILFCVLFVLVNTSLPKDGLAQSADPKIVMSQFQEYCIAAIKVNISTADFALQRKLVETSPEDSKKISPDGGRVFALPSLKGAGVLTTNLNFNSVCSIAIHKTDSALLTQEIFKNFKSSTGFRLIKEKRNEKEGVTRMEFLGDMGGPVKILISSSDKPRPNGIQVLMTVGRVE